MRNEVTEKLEIFLQNLRCENGHRETLVHLDICKKESKHLAELEGEYRQVINGLNQHSRNILECYTEQIKSEAFAEQQEAYLQGMIDFFQILSGIGILSTNENVKKIIAEFKNGSPK